MSAKPGRPKGSLSGPRDVPGKIDNVAVEVLLDDMLKLDPFTPFSERKVWTVARKVLLSRGRDNLGDVRALARAFVKAMWHRLDDARFGQLVDHQRKVFADWWQQAIADKTIAVRPEDPECD